MNSQAITIEGKPLGLGHPCFIVFECGPTHDGLETAKKLVDVAADAGADAVKFQLIDSEKLVPSKETMFTYRYLKDKETNEVETVTESLQEILKRRELTRDEWAELIAYCKRKNLIFFSTASNKAELDFLSAHGVDTVKIASGDITYHHFLRQASEYDWSVQIDTGSSSIAEVEQAVDVLEGAGCRKIIINHCPSGYPAYLESVHLRTLTSLQQLFPYPIAFSDHNPGCTMDVAAVALGANMIEKTITLDKTIKSPEHIMSLEPDEAADFVRSIRELEIALGTPRRTMTAKTLIEGRTVVRRSIIAARDISVGEEIVQEMIDYARPGDGIPANLDSHVIGRVSQRNIAAGEKLAWGDFR
ncbi:N-acetylneuraminate synthase family protein [Pseudodesulfovibrio thermohalotolerans]|uniref:N-acetylneuraminate synthase family protein n=1 Tax=Pseudodesulfovibrio thermohalotolerans TaxID=2880651 RepID=UPI00244265D3|nr:N-acetylneuraminate synthase family protein [Pseudodesulfovibrio thermohalotolerans]WFS61220.1 N-acetylneuraminate synthase family protein [Pseudodesulfovibrio thermohalotolerans]